MEEVNGALPIVQAIIQWIIVPILVLLWAHNKRHGDHDSRFIKHEAENRRILTILEERSSQRAEDNARAHETMAKLAIAIDKLNSRLDRLLEQSK